MSSHTCIGCGVELVVGKNTRDYILAARFETGKVPAKVLAN